MKNNQHLIQMKLSKAKQSQAKLSHTKLSNVKFSHLKTPVTQKGVVLLEALIAILIFSMGILALVGLQAAMVKNTSDNKYRADASFLAQQSIGLGWANATNAAGASQLANIACAANAPCSDVSNVLPNGSRTVTVGNQGLVTVNVTWNLPSGVTHSYATQTYIGAY